MQSTSSTGCYGLVLDGVDDARPFLGPVAPDSPRLRAVRRPWDEAASTRLAINDVRANLPLSDGRSVCRLDRASGVAELILSQDYADEALIHPLLSGACAVTNWWHGRDAFHAGAFVHDDRAWVLIGDKGAGKSTALAYLALNGFPVLSDDVIVVDDGDVLPGPSFVDLRPEAAARLDTGRDLGVLGARERFRLDLPTPPDRVPLGGWIFLDWAAEPSLAPLPVADRFTLLLQNRALLLRPAAPQAFLGYAAKPCFVLRRAKDWNALADIVDVISRSLVA